MDSEGECKSNSEECNFEREATKECKLTDSQKTQLEENFPDILELIHCLYKIISKQRTKIHKLKSKLKTRAASKHVGVQTEPQTVSNDAPKNISEEIKEAAEMAMQKTGFVYEETSGLYYDYSTGYYYNSELGLYYDGNTGTYMIYNCETRTYDFHSQVDVAPNAQSSLGEESKFLRNKRKKKPKDGTKGCKRERSDNPGQKSELEEGECSDNSSTSSQESFDDKQSERTDISRGWPPCMRIIVKNTEVSKLKEGALHIITYEGGTLGREGDHAIIIPDINISKHHLKFSFDKSNDQYLLTDLGSRNGTYLNGKRISASKQESEPMEVVHGSQIQIGSTVLLCHIHTGNETCGHCEPGLIQPTVVEISSEPVINVDKSKQHKNELKKLRKKFGITWTDSGNTQLAKGYTDRAKVRRDIVGSQNEHEKTQVASVDQAISSENKGFKLLSKMGWSEGQSLGKEGTGLLNPVELVSNPGVAGMGYTGLPPVKIDPAKESVWKKTQERYEKVPHLEELSDDYS